MTEPSCASMDLDKILRDQTPGPSLRATVEYVTCPRCGCSCRVGLHHSANCIQCSTTFRTDISCPGCGQLGHDGTCDTCKATERAPQGETVRLFEPAPNQIAGQLSF